MSSSDFTPALHVLAIRDALPTAEQVLAGPIVRELRMRKDAAEIDALRTAGAAIDRVHARVGEWLRPGRTEAEVGADIAAAIVEEGHTEADFVIVGSGPANLIETDIIDLNGFGSTTAGAGDGVEVEPSYVTLSIIDCTIESNRDSGILLIASPAPITTGDAIAFNGLGSIVSK